MQLQSSLTRLQQPIKCPYTQRDQSSTCPPNEFHNINFNIILPSMPKSYKWSLSHRCPPPKDPLFSPIRATCPDHLILYYLMRRVIFREQYRSESYSLSYLLYSPLTYSLLTFWHRSFTFNSNKSPT
jgi:hypothetical protein